MKCKHVQKYLVDYLYGELKPEKTTAFEKHLEQCAGCRRDVGSYRETVALFGELESAEPSQLPGDNILREARKAASAFAQRPAKRSWIIHAWVPAVSAALVVFTIGVTLYFTGFPKRGAPEGEPVEEQTREQAHSEGSEAPEEANQTRTREQAKDGNCSGEPEGEPEKEQIREQAHSEGSEDANQTRTREQA